MFEMQESWIEYEDEYVEDISRRFEDESSQKQELRSFLLDEEELDLYDKIESKNFKSTKNKSNETQTQISGNPKLIKQFV